MDAGAGPHAGPLSIDVRLVILPRDMAETKCRADNLGDSVMGRAISGAGKANGRIAYVFYDRIAQVALSQLTPTVRGLGYVMAHEMGHLLIGENSHADAGLMQPNWNPRDSRLQTFTASQVQTIRHRFTTTSANSAN